MTADGDDCAELGSSLKIKIKQHRRVSLLQKVSCGGGVGCCTSYRWSANSRFVCSPKFCIQLLTPFSAKIWTYNKKRSDDERMYQDFLIANFFFTLSTLLLLGKFIMWRLMLVRRGKATTRSVEVSNSIERRSSSPRWLSSIIVRAMCVRANNTQKIKTFIEQSSRRRKHTASKLITLNVEKTYVVYISSLSSAGARIWPRDIKLLLKNERVKRNFCVQLEIRYQKIYETTMITATWLERVCMFFQFQINVMFCLL